MAPAIFDFTHYYIIRAVHSNLVLDVEKSSTANGAVISQWAEHGGPNQQFFFVDRGNGAFSIHARHAPNSCVDVREASTANGANVHLWKFVNGSNQRWRFKKVGNGVVIAPEHASGKVLDLSGGSRENGGRVIQWVEHGNSNQQFRFERKEAIATLATPVSVASAEKEDEDMPLLVQQLLEYALYSALVVSAQLLDVLRARPFPFEPQSAESAVLVQLKPMFKCLADLSSGAADSTWYD